MQPHFSRIFDTHKWHSLNRKDISLSKQVPAIGRAKCTFVRNSYAICSIRWPSPLTEITFP